MRSSTLRRALHDPRRVAALAIGVLAGPVVWLTLLEVNYVMTYVACEQRHDWMLHLASIVALALVALAGLSAWRARSRGPSEAPTTSQDETSELRARFFAYGGALMCAWFSIVIIATEIPVMVYTPCQ
jgi:amino acid transporter